MNPRVFDHYLRSVTSSALALGIVGAVIYQFMTTGRASAELLGWAGLIVGAYIGVNAAVNGSGLRVMPERPR